MRRDRPERCRRLRAMRVYAGMDQHELAAGLDLSDITYKRIETGGWTTVDRWHERVPTDDELCRAAELCNVPRSFALGGFESGVSEQARDALLRVIEDAARALRAHWS